MSPLPCSVVATSGTAIPRDNSSSSLRSVKLIRSAYFGSPEASTNLPRVRALWIPPPDADPFRRGQVREAPGSQKVQS